MQKKIFIYLIILLICLPILSQAEGKYKKRLKIGLVLSGGGARGAAHVGVLKVLEELRIPIDYVAGTSMGSVVGGLYASGMSAQQIEKALNDIDWDEVFHDKPARQNRSFRRKLDDDLYLVKKKPGFNNGKIELPLALIQGQKFDLALNRLASHVNDIHDFNKLPIPFRAVATNIETGKEVVLSRGSLARALRASMAVPGAFAPVMRNGVMLVDGGIANNLPINIVRNMGADILIVVNIGTPLKKSAEIKSSIDMLIQVISLLGQRYLESQLASLKSSDILILPKLGKMSSSDFKNLRKAMPIGEAGANALRHRLVKLSVSEQAYDRFLASRKINRPGKPTMHFVTIKNNSKLSDKMIQKKLGIKPGDKLDTKKLEKNIEKIYGLDVFQNVRYKVARNNGRLGLEISAEAKEWGPNYLQFGLAISDNFDGESAYNIGIAYTRTAINGLNGEWRTSAQFGQAPLLSTELYQPLDVGSRYFINPKIFAVSQNQNVADTAGNLQAQYRTKQFGINLDAGRNFGNWGEFRVGYQYSSGEAEVRIGNPLLDNVEFDTGRMFARFSIDTLDNSHFPRHGYLASLEYRTYKESLKSDDNFDQILFAVGGAKTWGRNTYIVATNYFTTENDAAPFYGLFSAGGFFNLSGYNIAELSGQHFAMIKAAYLRKVTDSAFLPAYLGMTLEYGGVSQTSSDLFDNFVTAGSVFVGLDTEVGPVYFGFGSAQGGHNSIFLSFGKIF